MNTDNGFVVLEWPYGLRLKTNAETRATSRETIESATFACSVVDTRTGIVPPGFDREYPTPEDARDAFIRLGPTLATDGIAPEVDRVLTISTAHVTSTTARALDSMYELPIAVYPKATFGWLVYLGGVSEKTIERLPDDLRACVRFAVTNDCSILCLDSDAVPLTALPTYEWGDDAPHLD